MTLTYGTVCSGIEAPSSAVHPLGWTPLWFSEIEPFPKAVLAHHYPTVPDLGDMTALPAGIRAGTIPAPDIFIGGTPCQSFSVAGLRKGLADPRGQLTRTFVEILDALDDVRAKDGKPPAVALWENVPGVLSDKDNAFGNFLAALVGEDEPLQPAGPRWTDAGCVLGPTRTAAWRVLDAQYFGVAQRRRRVFVVVCARTGPVDPVEVLLVEEGLRRDTPPSREAGEDAAADPRRSAAGGGGDRAGHDGRGGGGVTSIAFTTRGREGGLSVESQEEIAYALKNPGEGGRSNDRMIATCSHPEVPEVVGTLSDGAHNGGGSTARTRTRDASSPSTQYPELPEVAWCLQHRDAKGADSDTKPGHVIPVGGSFDPVAFDTTQITHPENRCNPQPGDPCHPLAPAVAFTGDGVVADPIGAHEASTYTNEGSGNFRLHNCVKQSTMSVRRLTPVECERLQGFPDNHTLIPWKGKPAADCPDGPRYKALGNSMAVPVIRWIARKIERALS